MEQTQRTTTYCLSCVSGKEDAVFRILKMEGFFPLLPSVEKWVSSPNGPVKKRKKLIPGYVFFDGGEKPDWNRLKSRQGILKVLHYEDGSRALRGSDLEFANWLKRYAGVIEVTKVIREGTKIVFTEGPLKDLKGEILTVNKRRRQVEVALGGDGDIIRRVWCGIEYLEPEAAGKG